MSEVEIIILILLLSTEGKGELSQFVEEKSIQLVLDIAELKKGQCTTSTLTPGWWQMPYRSSYSSGSKTIGSTETNPSGLLHYRKILLSE